MLHLVSCEITEHHYMNDCITHKMSHIVEAENTQEAEKKVEKFYTEKDDEFSIQYSVIINYINQIII